MSGYKNFSPRGGKNRGTMRYRPKELQASDPQMTERQKNRFGCRIQRPDQLLAMVMNDDVRCDQFDLEDWEAIEQAAESRQFFEENIQLKAENAALKAEIEALKAENAALKSQQSNPPAPQSLKGTGYRDAVSISPATIQKMKIANFSRRVSLFFILLDAFNSKLDDYEAEIEGCGSILRKIFELVTSISGDIPENTLTIPDLDFKFYGSKSDFEAFAKKVSEWIGQNELNIPGTHFIIGKMYRFTAKKTMLNGQIVEYEKFTLEVIDSSTKEIFMIDIMNMDGSTVFPCDFSVNALAVSPKRGIHAKDPLHRKGKFNFLGVIRDIFSRTTTCMTKCPWKFEKQSLNFLVRQIKMIEAGYEMQGAPVLTTATCLVMCDDALCVSLTGCRCKDTKGVPIPVQISIYTTISISQQGKRCPNCRDVLKEFVCSAVESRQSMCEPKKLPSKAKFEWLVDRAEEMSKGYSFTGFEKYSEGSKDAMRVLADFSRRNEEAEEDAQMRAVSGSAAPVPAPQMRAAGGAAEPVLAPQMRAEAEDFDHHQIEREIVRDFLQDLFRLRLAEQAQARADAEQDRIDALIFGGEPVPAPQMRAAAEAQARAIQMRAAAQVPAPPMRAGGGAAAPVPAPPMRAGGGAAAPLRRRQYDSDSDGEYGYIRRYGS
jgi:hypothetical protein